MKTWAGKGSEGYIRKYRAWAWLESRCVGMVIDEFDMHIDGESATYEDGGELFVDIPARAQAAYMLPSCAFRLSLRAVHYHLRDSSNPA